MRYWESIKRFSMELVSVIIPVYNQEKYLNKCIDTVLTGTYGNVECIIVDDGSTDNSPALCDEYKKDKRVKVIHKPNGGLTSARKAGFDVSKGEYITFIDSDDYVTKDYVEKLFRALTDAGADMSICGHYRDEDGKIIENTYPIPDRVLDGNITNDYILPIIGKIYAPGYENFPGYVWGKLYKRECITDKCFVSEREVYTEDDIFQMYVCENVNKIVFIKDKLVYYRDNVKSLTRRYRNGMWDMLKKRHMLVEEYFKAHNIKDKDRLIASAFYAIYVSVTNSYLHGNVTECVKELRAIRKDSFAVKTLKEVRTKLLRPRQKMFYMLFKLRCYHLVYHFRNTMF